MSTVYEALIPKWAAAVQPFATDLFIALAGLDLAFFGWSLWRQYRGDITAAILSTTNRLLLIGLFLDLLLKGPEWTQDIINMFITVGKAGGAGFAIQPSVVLVRGVDIAGAMLGQALKSGLLADLLTGVAMVIAAVVILISFLVITVEFVITKIQTFLAMGMGLFFLAFGGSTWTRTYVERYFSYAVSSGTRLMTLYFLIGAGFNLSQNWIGLAAQAPVSSSGVLACWIIGAGAVIYAMICWRGPAVAAGHFGRRTKPEPQRHLGRDQCSGASGSVGGVDCFRHRFGSGSWHRCRGWSGGAGGASMKAGATAPSAANGASAAAGSHATANGGSQAAGAMQSASSKGNGKNGSGGGPDFGGLDS